MFLLLISFLGGVLTVLAPCILPLLPVIVGGSLSDGHTNKRKAFTIVAALGVSVIVFTLVLKVSTLFINIPEYTWKIISGSIILFFGVVTIFPKLWESQLLAKLSSRANRLVGAGDQKKSFAGDVIVGAALGPVFSTCSPTYFIVLATVLPVNPALGMLYLLAYTIGLCLSLLVVAFVGQKIMAKLDVAADPHGTFKRVLGVLFVLVGLGILTGLDKQLQTKILSSGFFDVTKIEQKLLQYNSDTQQVSTTTVSIPENNKSKKSSYLTASQKFLKYRTVPELSSIDGYINTDGKPITLASLRGKVVLLDIWTYSCINCRRTIPYINEWYKKYKDQGLEVVGLHTPEFAFEKVQANVERAVKDFKIEYPVVLDNDYSTWRSLGNQFWPRKYLVDVDGYIIYDHIGEGAYEETEKEIQNALEERAARLGDSADISSVGTTKLPTPVGVDASKVKSPEVYFGSARNDYLANGRMGTSGKQDLTLPADGVLVANKLYLSGTWNITTEYVANEGAASIVFSYDAKNVYMAAGSDVGVEVEIYRDDIFVKKLMIKDETLYDIIAGSDYGKHVLRIVVPKAGLKAFTFTFG